MKNINSSFLRTKITSAAKRKSGMIGSSNVPTSGPNNAVKYDHSPHAADYK